MRGDKLRVIVDIEFIVDRNELDSLSINFWLTEYPFPLYLTSSVDGTVWTLMLCR